jgi:hypothetical protein
LQKRKAGYFNRGFMKKSILPALLPAFLFLFASCQSELAEPASLAATETLVLADQEVASCTGYFYFDGPNRVELGAVLPDRIVIGFRDGLSAQQRSQVLSQYSFVDTVASSFHSGSADVTVVLLQPGLSCTQVERGLEALVAHPSIRYGNPVFNPNQEAWDYGLTNQVIVTVRPEYSRADVEQVARKYAVEVVDDLGGDTFVLSVDKRSGASTLEAVNLIARSNKVVSCSPDFLFLPAGN